MFRNMKVLVALVLVLVSVFALSAAAMADSTIDDILALVNQERAAAGLKPVSLNNGLNQVAGVRAEEASEVFEHARPDGKSWKTAFAEAGIDSNYRGENLAYGQTTAEEVFNAWMNSASHRSNILNGNFTDLGIALYEKDGVIYWAQSFANTGKTTNSDKKESGAKEEKTSSSSNEKTTASNTQTSAKSESTDAPSIDLNVVRQRTAAAPTVATNPGL